MSNTEQKVIKENKAIQQHKAIFDKAYFEDGVKNKLDSYFERQRISSVDVADRLERLLPLKRGFSRILEIGCAYGQTVNALRLRGYPAYGCDISEYAINTGRTLLNVPVFCANMEDKEFVEIVRNQTSYADFDLITSCITLEHIHEEYAERIIKDMYTLTAPGGYAYHAIDLDKGDDITHYCIKPRQWWIDKFKEAGFEEMPVSALGVYLNWFLFQRR